MVTPSEKHTHTSRICYVKIMTEVIRSQVINIFICVYKYKYIYKLPSYYILYITSNREGGKREKGKKLGQEERIHMNVAQSTDQCSAKPSGS